MPSLEGVRLLAPLLGGALRAGRCTNGASAARLVAFAFAVVNRGICAIRRQCACTQFCTTVVLGLAQGDV